MLRFGSGSDHLISQGGGIFNNKTLFSWHSLKEKIAFEDIMYVYIQKKWEGDNLFYKCEWQKIVASRVIYQPSPRYQMVAADVVASLCALSGQLLGRLALKVGSSIG